MERTKPSFWGESKSIVCIVCIVSMGIARQLHVRINKGMVIHRPGIRLPTLTLYLSGIANQYVRLFDSLDYTIKCNRMFQEYPKRCSEIKAFLGR